MPNAPKPPPLTLHFFLDFPCKTYKLIVRVCQNAGFFFGYKSRRIPAHIAFSKKVFTTYPAFTDMFQSSFPLELEAQTCRSLFAETLYIWTDIRALAWSLGKSFGKCDSKVEWAIPWLNVFFVAKALSQFSGKTWRASKKMLSKHVQEVCAFCEQRDRDNVIGRSIMISSLWSPVCDQIIGQKLTGSEFDAYCLRLQ